MDDGATPGRLSLSGLWADTLAAFNAHRGIFLTLAAAFVLLPQLLFSLFVESRFGGVSLQQLMQQMTRDGLPGWFWPLYAAIILLQMLCVIPIVRVVLGLAPDETVGQLIAGALQRLGGFALALLTLFAAYLLVAVLLVIPLGLAVGFTRGGPGATVSPLAALVAGLFLGVILYLAARMVVWLPVFVVENPGPVQCIRRSWALTRGRAGRIVVILLALILAVLVVSLAIGALGSALGVVGTAVAGQSLGQLLFLTLNAVVGAVLAALSYVFVAQLYRRLAA